jgi:acyl-coenzyme A synthetase/AMP-(fatty) acid ligase
VITPVHLRAVLADAGELPPVDLIVSATAPLSPQLAAEAERRFEAPVLEIYGCSETGQLASRRTTAAGEWHGLDGVQLQQDASGTWASGAFIETETLLGDIIELRRQGRFILHGRTADMVNIAGKRTSLAYLNHQLNSIPGVVDGVFVMPDDRGDAPVRLAAFAVAPELKPEDVLAALRQRVDPVFLPRPLRLVDALPRNVVGKLPRDAVTRLAAELLR